MVPTDPSAVVGHLLLPSDNGLCIEVECSLHRALGYPQYSGHPADRRGFRVHSLAFLHLFTRESAGAAKPLTLCSGSVQAGLHSLAGGVHLVSTIGHHHPPEVLRRGAVVGGVDVLLDRDNPDLLLGQVCLDLHALFEVPTEPVQLGDHDGVVGLD
jgi:hypothetical protein